MKFTDLTLHKNILKGIQKAGFTDCLPVQIQTFEQTLNNHQDVCVQSQTGTGKTAAYLISIFQLILTHDSLKKKKALIVAPTRELAVQIAKEAQLLGSYLDRVTGEEFAWTVGLLFAGVSASLYNLYHILYKETRK